ncbi:MAG: hypothetical protein MHM6MM_000995 [Cercozoa sp. M6MM]
MSARLSPDLAFEILKYAAFDPQDVRALSLTHRVFHNVLMETRGSKVYAMLLENRSILSPRQLRETERRFRGRSFHWRVLMSAIAKSGHQGALHGCEYALPIAGRSDEHVPMPMVTPRNAQHAYTNEEHAHERQVLSIDDELPDGYEWHFRCPLTNDNLAATPSPDFSFCNVCQKNVQFVPFDKPEVLRDAVAAGRCVSLVDTPDKTMQSHNERLFKSKTFERVRMKRGKMIGIWHRNVYPAVDVVASDNASKGATTVQNYLARAVEALQSLILLPPTTRDLDSGCNSEAVWLHAARTAAKGALRWMAYHFINNTAEEDYVPDSVRKVYDQSEPSYETLQEALVHLRHVAPPEMSLAVLQECLSMYPTGSKVSQQLRQHLQQLVMPLAIPSDRVLLPTEDCAMKRIGVGTHMQRRMGIFQPRGRLRGEVYLLCTGTPRVRGGRGGSARSMLCVVDDNDSALLRESIGFLCPRGQFTRAFDPHETRIARLVCVAVTPRGFAVAQQEREKARSRFDNDADFEFAMPPVLRLSVDDSTLLPEYANAVAVQAANSVLGAVHLLNQVL